MVRIYTAQIAKWRKCKELGIPLIDTTVKSGIKIFAPSWDIVSRVKAGTLSEAGYTEQYLAMMRVSFGSNKEEWLALLRDNEAIAIACYCTAGKFCHRYLLVEYLVKVCEHFGIEYELCGEIV